MTSALAAVPVTGGAAGGAGGAVVLSGGAGGGVAFAVVGATAACDGVADAVLVDGTVVGDVTVAEEAAALLAGAAAMAGADLTAALTAALAGAETLSVGGPGLTLFAEWPHAAVNSARPAITDPAAVAFGVRLMVHLRPATPRSGAE
jgi:hypothetical protein